jgi:hypothetical protein
MSDTITVGTGVSYFNDRAVNDKQIASLVGLDTYKALYWHNQDLYKELNYDMEPKNYYYQLVEAILMSETTATALKKELIRLVMTEESSHEGAKSLVASSYIVKHYQSSFLESVLIYTAIMLISLIAVRILFETNFFRSIIFESWQQSRRQQLQLQTSNGVQSSL